MDKVIICDVDMKYRYSLKYFLKDEFKVKDADFYIVPTKFIIDISRELFPKIREGCSYVCPSEIPCNQHKFLNCIQKIIEFLYYSVEEDKLYYKSFKVFFNEENSDFFGWSWQPMESKCLKHLSYSRRLAYLN